MRVDQVPDEGWQANDPQGDHPTRLHARIATREGLHGQPGLVRPVPDPAPRHQGAPGHAEIRAQLRGPPRGEQQQVGQRQRLENSE